MEILGVYGAPVLRGRTMRPMCPQWTAESGRGAERQLLLAPPHWGGLPELYVKSTSGDQALILTLVLRVKTCIARIFL